MLLPSIQEPHPAPVDVGTHMKDNTFRMRLFHAVLALVVKIQFGISNRQKDKHKLIPMLRFWQAAFLSSYNSLVEAGKGFRHQQSRVNLWDLTGKEV